MLPTVEILYQNRIFLSDYNRSIMHKNLCMQISIHTIECPWPTRLRSKSGQEIFGSIFKGKLCMENSMNLLTFLFDELNHGTYGQSLLV